MYPLGTQGLLWDVHFFSSLNPVPHFYPQHCSRTPPIFNALSYLPNFVSSLSTTNFNWWYKVHLVLMFTFHGSMTDLPGAIFLKKTDSPSTRKNLVANSGLIRGMSLCLPPLSILQLDLSSLQLFKVQRIRAFRMLDPRWNTYICHFRPAGHAFWNLTQLPPKTIEKTHTYIMMHTSSKITVMK